MNEKFHLGVGRATITPKVGALLFGYVPDLESTSINDDLTATAFCFEAGEEKALLVSLTVGNACLSIVDEIRDTVTKKYGIAKSSIIIAAIHTHSAPNLSGMHGWGEIDSEYLNEIFYPGVYAAIDDAVNSKKAVTMAVAKGESLIGVNRREIMGDNTVRLGQNPWGPFDPTMTILSFKDEEGAPVANIIHYGAHATAAGPNKEVSRDWPGVMIDMLEAESGAITAFVNGPEGDVGPRLPNGRTTGGSVLAYALRHGAWAGQDAVRIYKNNMGVYHTPTLTTLGASVDIPLKPRIPLDEAKEAYELYRGETVNHRGHLEKYYREVIESYENGFEEASVRTFEQNIIRIGDVAFVAFSHELFSEIGLRIKKESKIPFVLSLSNANGTNGYFATESELCRGGYEIKMTNASSIQAHVDNADWYMMLETLKNLEKTEK